MSSLALLRHLLHLPLGLSVLMREVVSPAA
jgi:hypothetical protein